MLRPRRSCVLATLAFAAIAAHAGVLRAGDDEARALIVEGQAAAAAGDHKKAAASYEAAWKASGNPTVLIAVALAHREAGNTTAARSALTLFLEKAPADHKRRTEMETLLAELGDEKDVPAAKAAAKDATPAETVAPAGEDAPAGGRTLEFAPEPIQLQLDDVEKPQADRKPKAKPLTIVGRPPPPPPREPPFYEKWWFWAVGGVALAAAVTTGVLITRPADSKPHACPAGVLGCFGDGRTP